MPGVYVSIHVTPKSARDEVAGWRGGELSVRVSAAPEGGKATAAACKAVARALGVPKSAVRVSRGATSRHKRLEVFGLSESDVYARLGTPGEAGNS